MSTRDRSSKATQISHRIPAVSDNGLGRVSTRQTGVIDGPVSRLSSEAAGSWHVIREPGF